MMQITYLGPRARRSDPSTSHAAAHNAHRCKAQQLREDIRHTLQRHGPRTAREIALLLDEDYIAVQRRMSETERICRTGVVRDGCAEWAADDACYFAEMGEADRTAREGRG